MKRWQKNNENNKDSQMVCCMLHQNKKIKIYESQVTSRTPYSTEVIQIHTAFPTECNKDWVQS